MSTSELELKSQLEVGLSRVCLFEWVAMECPSCVVQEGTKGRLSWSVVFGKSNEVDVEDKYLLLRTDVR